MKITITLVIKALIIGLIAIGVSYTLLPKTVVAQTGVPMARTIDSEIIRLAKQYSVNERTVRKIISCESKMKENAINHNIDKDGNVWSSDFGYFQINDYFHEEDMKELGMDIRNKWDNLEYGFILISKRGFLPWSASFKCWSKL